MLTSYYVFNHIPSLLSSPPLPHRLLVYCGLGKAVQTSGEREEEEEEVNNVSLTLSALSMSWLPSVVDCKMIRFVEVGNSSAKKKSVSIVFDDVEVTDSLRDQSLRQI